MIKDENSIEKDLLNNTLSVANVLDIIDFSDYHLLAGERGLENRCSHMVVLETPDGIEWVKGGEFLLTSGFAFKDSPQILSNLVSRAHKRGVAAIAIKEKRYLADIPKEMIEQGDEYNLPLVLLPQDSNYTDKIAAFYEALFYIKNEYLIQAKYLNERLLNLVFDEKKADGVVVGLSGLTNTSITVYDASFFEISSCLIKKEHKEVFEIIRMMLLNEEKDLTAGNNRLDFNSTTYFANYFSMPPDEIASYMCVVSDTEIGILQKNTIHHGCLVYSLKVKKEEQQSLKEIKIKRTLTELILNKAYLGKDFYYNIEQDYSWNKKKNVVGIIVTFKDVRDNFRPDEVGSMKSYLYRIINRIFDGSEYLLTERQNSIIIFLGIRQIDEVKHVIKKIMLYLKKQKNTNIITTYGVSQMYKSIEDISDIYNECMITTMFEKQNEIIYYSSLDTVKLIYPLKEDKQFLKYYDKTIRVLLEYDEKYGGELVQTLKCFYESNMNKKDTAKNLFIHVETLRYRLNKIEQLTGYDLDTSEGLLVLHLGLKLYNIVSNNEVLNL